MKKSIKILALILTLALVCGALVIGTFAAAGTVGYDYANRETVTGETTFLYMDYEQLAVQSFGLATELDTQGDQTKITANSGQNAGLYYAGRQGECSIVSAAKGDANKYLKVDMTAESLAAADQGPYQTFSLGTPTTGANAVSGNYVSLGKLNFLVLEYDIYFPDGIPDGDPRFAFEFRSFDASGARKFPPDIGGYMTSNSSYFRNVSGVPSYRHNVNGWKDYAINVNQWNHFTVILQTSNQDATTGAFDLSMYTAINGKIVLSDPDCCTRPTDASKWYNGDMGGLYAVEARFGFGNATDGKTLALDNVAIRTFDKTYEGNLGDLLAQGNGTDLTKWDANVFDPSLLPYGKTTVMNGDVEYSNLQKAIDAAEDGDTLTLLADSTDTVTVDKELTIDGAGQYTCNVAVTAGSGFALTNGGDDDDFIWTVEAATDAVEVYISGCECGNGCFDEVTLELTQGTNIWQAYMAEVGKAPTCEPVIDEANHTANVFRGFVDNSGLLDILGLTFDESLVVTEDMLGESIELVPVYEDESAWAVVGETYFYPYQGASALFTTVPAGSTITLIDNVEVTTAIKIATNNLTLDLAGYRMSAFQAGSGIGSESKIYLFTTTADEFTITSSVVGGTIYNNVISKVSWGYQIAGDGIVSAGKKGAKINLLGTNEAGETTLSMYAATIVLDYGTPGNVTIDGGNYIGSGTDGWGFFNLRATGQLDAKNAYFNTTHSRMFAFGGQGSGDATEHKVTFDNCVFEGTNFGDIGFAELKVNITNSYIGVPMDCNDIWGATSNAHPELASCYILGEGNFIEDGITCTAALADGMTKYDVSVVKEYNYLKAGAPAKTDAAEMDSLVATIVARTEVSETVNYTTFVAPEGLEAIPVTWLDTDGETVIGTTEAFPGLNATAPATDVPGTNGMVQQIAKDWVGGTYIPLDATEMSFTLAEGSEATYVAGKVEVLFNFDMINHFQYNHYLPAAPEGVTYVSFNANNGGEIAYGNWRFPTNPNKTDLEGNKWYGIPSWPGAHGVDNNFPFTVTYQWNGMNFTYVAPEVTLAKYVNYVFTSGKYDTIDQTAFKTAMADLMRMVEQANVAAGSNTDAAFDEVYALVEPYMSVVDNVIDKTATNDISSIEAYVDGVAVVYSKGLNSMTVEVDPKAGYVATVTTNEKLHGQIIVGQTRTNILTSDMERCYAHNIRSWGLTSVMTISIYNKADVTIGGSGNQEFTSIPETPVATAQFTIAGYLNDNAESLTAADLALAEAMFAYANSGAAYMDWRSAYWGKA